VPAAGPRQGARQKPRDQLVVVRFGDHLRDVTVQQHGGAARRQLSERSKMGDHPNPARDGEEPGLLDGRWDGYSTQQAVPVALLAPLGPGGRQRLGARPHRLHQTGPVLGE
jgi:hypothetical protein